MGFGSNNNVIKPSPYMREHSQHIRFLSKHSGDTIEEDPIATGLSPTSRIILVIACRNRQRLLSHAWQLWVNNTGVFHNYKQDVTTILSRILADDELRTEFEIEVIFKWVLQNHHVDPTGIAYTLYMCNSKSAIIKAIQHFRLERYLPHTPIMLQNDYPKPEEGHYTIIHGLVDIVIFPPDSPELLRLHTAKKNKQDNEIIEILNTGKTIDTMPEGAGFGELSTITGMKRSASVRAHYDHTVDLIVIPQVALLDLLQHRRVQIKGSEIPNYPSAEVMDYLRQSGLIYKAAMIDVMEAASCMVKTQYVLGSVLYKKGDPVRRIYIILYGEVLLDTRSYEEGLSRDNEPFQHLDVDKCYLLRSGSILGDEGMGGKNQYFESSAIVVSESAVFFEVTGYGISFLLNRLGIEKYSALVYKDIPVEIEKLESLNDDLILHSTFMSLRKAIAIQNPYRGKLVEVKQSYLLKDIEINQHEQDQLLERNVKLHPQQQSPTNSPPRQTTINGSGVVGGGGLFTLKSSFNHLNSHHSPHSHSSSHQPLLSKTSPHHHNHSSPSRSLHPQTQPHSHSHHNTPHLNRLPSRLSSPGSKPSSPMLPSTSTPLGLMLSTNHKLSKSLIKRPYSPSQSPTRMTSPSQTNILKLDNPDHHQELTIFETRDYSHLTPSKSNSFRLPRSRIGSPTTAKERGRSRGGGSGSGGVGGGSGSGERGIGTSEPTSPNHQSRPYSRQSDRDAFFKTLEGAQYKKTKVLKQAALHHVQSIYKMIKKREMRLMRLQATENVVAKTKRELLEQKLRREATTEKTHNDIYHELAMKHSVGEEKYQRALAAYNGRRELESLQDESEDEQHAAPENPTGGLLEIATATVLNEYTENTMYSPPMSPSINPKFRISGSKPMIDQYYAYIDHKKQFPGSQWNELSPRGGDQRPKNLLHSKSMMEKSKKEVFSRYSTIYTVGVETVKVFDKDGHGRVVVVKQKSVLSLDNSLKKSSGTNTTSRKYKSQLSYVSKNSFSFDDDSSVSSVQSLVQKKAHVPSPNVAKIDKIIQAISDPQQSARVMPKSSTKAIVPDHLWNTRYLRHHRPHSPNNIYRAGRVDAAELSREELLEITKNSLKLATSAGQESSRDINPLEQTSERTLHSNSSQPTRDDFSSQRLLSESGSIEIKSNSSSTHLKPNILQSWQNHIEKDPVVCQYMEGRKRSSAMSRFRIGISSKQKNDSDFQELQEWTSYCGQNTLQIKNGSLPSLPVLSNNGSHSLYWSKKIVTSDGEIINNDESLLHHSLQKLTMSTR